jgi:hypothetical protein
MREGGFSTMLSEAFKLAEDCCQLLDDDDESDDL